jgi:hypothetical protein
MSETQSVGSGEITVLRQQTGMSQYVVKINLDGITQEESLIQPDPAGNCLNWVVGHLIAIYQHALPLLGQEPVIPAARIDRYDRGSPALRARGEAIDIGELLAAFDECSRRFDAGLAALDPETLGERAPFSPSDNPNETIGSLLTTFAWHQAYHTGQTGVLRRIAGKPGAIR